MLGAIASALGRVGGALGAIISVVSYVPQIIALVEKIAKIFGRTSGAEKKAIVLALVRDSLMTMEGISKSDIVDEAKFAAGLSKVVDGIVEMLNASVWYKK